MKYIRCIRNRLLPLTLIFALTVCTGSVSTTVTAAEECKVIDERIVLQENFDCVDSDDHIIDQTEYYENEYGIVFNNLDEVDPVVYEPNDETDDGSVSIMGVYDDITIESEKYIPVGHRSGEEYVNYHTTVKQQSISADAVNGKRTYINETCWGHVVMGALEASFNKKHGISNAMKENRGLNSADGALDLSERAITYFTYFNDSSVEPDPAGTLGIDKNTLYIGDTDITKADVATIPQAFAIGGTPYYAMESLAMGIGPVTEEQVPYSTEKEPKLNYQPVDAKYKYGTEFTLSKGYVIDMAQKDVVKSMILKYGGVSTAISYSSSYPKYTDADPDPYGKYKVGTQKRDENGYPIYDYMRVVSVNSVGDRSVLFHHPSLSQNHNILIVGWDDTIAPDCFVTAKHPEGAQKPGAWLCKNSYGNETNALGNTGSIWTYEYGYFWVSYDTTDKLLYSNGVRRGFVFDMDTLEGRDQGVEDNLIYQYDGSAFSKEITAGSSYANIYEVRHGQDNIHEYLRSVMVKLSTPGSIYSVQIYADPTDDDPTSGTPLLDNPVFGRVEASGYQSLYLGKGIELNAKNRFSVVVNLFKEKKTSRVPGIYSSTSGLFSMSVGKNSLITSTDPNSSTVPALYCCLNGARSGQSMLFNINTKQWEDMFQNQDSERIIGNLRIKLKTVTKENVENLTEPDYGVIDHVDIGDFSYYDGIEVNNLPAKFKGLTVTDISFSGNDGMAIIRNDTGYAIQLSSYVEYKCYNNEGSVVCSGNIFTERLDTDERCYSDFYITSDTVKVVLCEGNVYRDDNGKNDSSSTENKRSSSSIKAYNSSSVKDISSSSDFELYREKEDVSSSKKNDVSSSKQIVTASTGNMAIVDDMIVIKLEGIDMDRIQVNGNCGIYRCTTEPDTCEKLGTVKAIKKGTIKLFIEQGRKKLTVCSIKVEQPKLKSKLKLRTGKNKKLKLSGTKRRPDSWDSSDNEIVLVEKDGTIYAKKAGTAIVTATIGDHKYLCHVTVK